MKFFVKSTSLCLLIGFLSASLSYASFNTCSLAAEGGFEIYINNHPRQVSFIIHFLKTLDRRPQGILSGLTNADIRDIALSLLWEAFDASLKTEDTFESEDAFTAYVVARAKTRCQAYKEEFRTVSRTRFRQAAIIRRVRSEYRADGKVPTLRDIADILKIPETEAKKALTFSVLHSLANTGKNGEVYELEPVTRDRDPLDTEENIVAWLRENLFNDIQFDIMLLKLTTDLQMQEIADRLGISSRKADRELRLAKDVLKAAIKR